MHVSHACFEIHGFPIVFSLACNPMFNKSIERLRNKKVASSIYNAKME
jgi:hypothetical protein